MFLRTKRGEHDMKLEELVGVIETSQTIEVYKVGEDGFCYQGLAAHLPRKLYGLDVESIHAYEWEIDILVIG